MSARARILIVEDDQACAEMYRAALRLAGYDVHIAGDGMTALTAIDRRRPDLVVLDLQLPRLRGEAILDELSADPGPRVPVVIVTGSDDTAMTARAAAVLRKPCEPGHLVSVVERHLREGREAKAPA